MIKAFLLMIGLLFSEAHAIIFYDILIQGPQQYSIHLGLTNDPFTVLEIKKMIQNHEKIDHTKQQMFRSGNGQELSNSEVIGPGDHSGNHKLVVKVSP